MERLTEYHAGVAVIKEKENLSKAMKKLAIYEDLEEKGIDLIKNNEVYQNICRRVIVDKEKRKLIEKVEEALGFKLFVWQQTYIERALFRCYGETTAKIIKDLLEVDKEPIRFGNGRYELFKKMSIGK